MLDLEQLRMFLAVVQRMNFTKAANDLYISHSTVSRTVSQLEAQLGTQLFLRTNRTISLTEAGKHLAARGHALLSDMEALEAEMRQFRENVFCQLHISMFNFYNDAFFRSYERFHRSNPTIDMSIQYRTLEEIQSAVSNGDSDIGITFSFALNCSPKFQTLPLVSGEFVVVVSSAHPLAKQDTINITDENIEQPIMLDIVDYPFVTTIGQDAQFQKSQRSFSKVDSIDSFFLQIKANMGIGILPEHVATQMGSGCSLLSLDGVDSTYQILMFWLKSNTNPAVQAFVNSFRVK